MKRVLLIGCGGAGKSTLARRMGEALSLPVIHLDTHFWRSGWVEPTYEEWVEQLRGLLQRDRWVMDGNFGRTLQMRLEAADTVVFLDTPRWRCIVRVIRRVLRYRGKTRADLAPGCAEKFDWTFLKWIWHYRKRNRRRILEIKERTADTHRWEMLAHPRDAEAFLASLRP